ncbi:Acryloyl-CoA reductase AcuI/YhdH (EC [Olavius algarvensis associated proteobacterium Delta 3]|nr:Acryloyl-CoA reductase AcuI/YhdH (EC [Olavius algarvensis associated proteobacterium Delta 3]CAB5148974.1 Acryloyl-CoA reductase AcuI/YhdH (EC [Olavius algarvensis associated proteobacterium Delta 3]
MTLADKFNALVITETGDKEFVRSVETRTIDDLPEGDVVVQVLFSSLNYKDVLSATGNRGVTRNYPHTPGIDAAGIVAESTDEAFTPGDNVIVTSYDLGMNTSGGFGQYIRVPSGWVVPQPEDLTAAEAMIYGTAGFTAAMSVWELVESGITPEAGAILVSGATGGVGSIAVSILSKLGYSVTAVNGVMDETDYLKRIGAQEVISIEDATDTSGRPLLKAQWAGAIDTVGGDILATTIKSTGPWGTVTCCGNVASPDLPLNVYPFILRGVQLIGIDSQNCPMPKRTKIWEKIASDWKIDWLEKITTEAPFAELNGKIDLMLQGQHVGRTIIKMTG